VRDGAHLRRHSRAGKAGHQLSALIRKSRKTNRTVSVDRTVVVPSDLICTRGQSHVEQRGQCREQCSVTIRTGPGIGRRRLN
jgi:hypothetical protein